VAQGTAIIEDDEFGRIMKVGAISYMQTFHTRCWRQIENFGKEWNILLVGRPGSEKFFALRVLCLCPILTAF